MKKSFRCEKCNKEYTTAKDCREHEKTCQPRSLEDRVEELERRLQDAEFHIELLKAAEGYRRRGAFPDAGNPINPLIGPWGPATCREGEGPWGPLNKKIHHNVATSEVTGTKGQTASMSAGMPKSSGYCRKPCK